MSNEALKIAADSNCGLLPEPYDVLYRAMGFSNFKLMFDHLGGQYVYVPSLRNVLSDAIKSQIVEDFNKRNVPIVKLARLYGYNCKYLRKVLNV